MKSPKTTLSAVVMAVLITSAALLLLTAMGSLIASHWLFTRWHSTIWMLSFVGFNALVVTVTALVKAREDHRAKSTATPSEPAGPRRLAGVGTVVEPR